MSARGSLVTNPGKAKSEFIAESKRYIPLLWLAFLPPEKWKGEDDAQFELDRESSIARARELLPFLAGVFTAIPTFKESATKLLDRLASLRCKTIGIDIGELVDPDPPNRDLGVALAAIQSRNESFSLSIPERTEENPFTGEMQTTEARSIDSTQALLLGVCWLTTREIQNAQEEELAEYVTGYLWE